MSLMNKDNRRLLQILVFYLQILLFRNFVCPSKASNQFLQMHFQSPNIIKILLMKEHQQQKKLYIEKWILPKRNQRQVGQMTNLIKKTFITNFYSVSINPELEQVCLYQAKFPQNIPGDSSQIFFRCIMQLRAQLKDSIKYICFSGKIIYGFRQQKIPITYQCKVQQETIEVQIKYIKSLQILQFMNDPKTRPMAFQFFNSHLNTAMRENNYCQMGKSGTFFSKNEQKNSQSKHNLQQVGLNVLRGFKFTFAMINREISLQLDVCSRVLQNKSLYQQLLNYRGDFQKMREFVIGKTVITRYGNYKVYTIEDIDPQKNPNSTFMVKQQQVSFKNYYRRAYNIDIEHNKQFLIKVKAPLKKFVSKKQKITVQQQYIYLIPELVCLTGMTDDQRANYQSMKALAPFTKLAPHIRFEKSSNVVSMLQDNQIIRIGNPKKMQGFIIDNPQIGYSETEQKRQNKFDRMKLMEPHYFRNWIYVYSQCNFRQASEAQQVLYNASRAYGIKYQQPTYLEALGRKFQHFQAILNQYFSHVQPENVEMCFIYLDSGQTAEYPDLKNYLVNKIGISSQIIKGNTVLNSKNSMSVASKVAIQMSCKAGSVPWIVINNVPYLHKRNFAYCSLSSSKSKGGFTVSFVGTINNECTKVFSHYALKLKKKDLIDESILKTWLLKWIRSYHQTNNNRLPDLLIMYRESVGQSLFKPVVEYEITILKKVIQQVRGKTKKSNYSPQIVYIFANKKINSRFYQQKYDQIKNPQPGSVITNGLSVDGAFDFHLAAQEVREGTCTPTHYVVGYNQSEMPQEDIIRFTYNQSYNYYNWQGAVKVPSMIQCANKLSKLAGESIKHDFVENKKSRISQSFYFL